MNEDGILELTYKTPSKPLYFRCAALCWMCGKVPDVAKSVWHHDGNTSFRYCSEKCKTDHESLKSGWKP